MSLHLQSGYLNRLFFKIIHTFLKQNVRQLKQGENGEKCQIFRSLPYTVSNMDAPIIKTIY